MKGTIFLSGGGGINQSFLLDNEFLMSLKELKILYIPVASYRHIQGFEACYDWITGSLTTISDNFIDIALCLDLNNIQVESLNEYGGIYIGGGNTYHLLNQIKNSSFDKALMNYLKQGGVVYGGSAGAIVMGKSIDTVPEENTSNFIHHKGLNQACGYSIRCHYVSEDQPRMQSFVTKTNLPLIGLPEDCGLIKETTGLLKVVGLSSAIVWGRNKKWARVKPGKFIPSVDE